MSLSDTAAGRLGKHKKKGLSLWGLTSLSNAAAQSLAAVGPIYSAQLFSRDFKSLPFDLTPNFSQGKTR
jgi:hypothetical protein